MHAVRYEDQISNSFRVGSFACQVASRLLIFNGSAEGRNSTPWLKVEGGARANQVDGGGSISEAEFLTFFQNTEWWSCVTHLRKFNV